MMPPATAPPPPPALPPPLLLPAPGAAAKKGELTSRTLDATTEALYTLAATPVAAETLAMTSLSGCAAAGEERTAIIASVAPSVGVFPRSTCTSTRTPADPGEPPRRRETTVTWFVAMSVILRTNTVAGETLRMFA